MGEVTFGILGCGAVSEKFATALMLHPSARLVAVASRSIETAGSFVANLGVKDCSAYGSYEALLRASRLDVVYIGTPAFRHHEDAMMCLQHGLAVVVEKPFASNRQEAEKVFNEARKLGLFCMEGMWMRFLPAYREILDIVGSGKLGEVQCLSADIGIPVTLEESDHRLHPESGGAMRDLGIYGLSLTLDVFGYPTSVTSTAAKIEKSVDMQSTVSLGYDNGQIATISSTFMAYMSNTASIGGSMRRLQIAETLISPETFIVKSTMKNGNASVKGNVKNLIKSSKWARRLKSYFPNGTQTFVSKVGNGFHHEISEVVDLIRKGCLESRIVAPADTLEVLRICDVARSQWS